MKKVWLTSLVTPEQDEVVLGYAFRNQPLALWFRKKEKDKAICFSFVASELPGP